MRPEFACTPAPALGRRSLLALGALMAWPGVTWSRALRADEQLLFVPGIARWTPGRESQLDVDVHAWVYERERRRGMRTVFARYLGLDLGAMALADRARFHQRCALFLTDSERRKVVDVAFDPPLDQALSLPATDASGRASMRATLDGHALGPEAAMVHFRAVLREGDARDFAGHAVLVPAQGLSVISDIDDTIKVTQVLDRREMLLNTFVRAFEATPGMAAHFQRLARQPGTRFHYLSASPIQLASPLKDFLRDQAFPPGSLHLRESTHWRTLIPADGASRAHKLGVIAQLFADFPLRRFLLVGDSAEGDPEIYAQAARAYPQRVAGIVIRDVRDEGREAPRFVQTFDGLPPALWHLLPPSGEGWPP